MNKFLLQSILIRSNKKQYQSWCGGFSLLELLIVIAVMAIIAAAGSGFYMNYGKSVEINSFSQTMIYDLKQAQSKSMIGEGGLKYGVHFVNSTKDYYEIFSTPTDYNDVGKVVISTNYLSNGVTFSDPAEGESKDIIFNKISGSTSPSSISIASTNNTSTINVSAIGVVGRSSEPFVGPTGQINI